MPPVDTLPPIEVVPAFTGFYLLKDGRSRLIKAVMEGKTDIEAVVV